VTSRLAGCVVTSGAPVTVRVAEILVAVPFVLVAMARY